MKNHIAIDINNQACDSKSSKAGIEDSCPVCMEIFKNCQKIFEYLPCHHFCCEVCTVKMKKFRQIEFKFLECPLCRETVTKKVKRYQHFPSIVALATFSVLNVQCDLLCQESFKSANVPFYKFLKTFLLDVHPKIPKSSLLLHFH